MWQGLCAMLSHSIMSIWDLSPAKIYNAWYQDLKKLSFLMSLCKNKSVRETAVGKR